ncbi:MAG: ABC transporter permease [Thermoanaerobaculia bacterium]
MKWMRVKAVARKEFLHVLRDPRSMGMGIGIPIILLLLFGYALTLDVDRVPTVVWDQDHSVESRELIRRLDGSRYLSIVGYVTDYRELAALIDRSAAMAGFVVPPGFSRDLLRGRAATVQLIVDGSDANTASIASGYFDAIVSGYSREVAVKNAMRRGRAVSSTPIDLRPRVWFNPELQSKNYIVPGLIAVIMMVIAALLTSLTVAREWETGTMEQLISTPVRAHELIFGKLVPYFTIGMLDILIAVLMGVFLFRVPLRGSVLLVFALGALYLVGALSMGILISIITRGQLLASQIAMVTTYLPAFLLSGFMFDIANMPRVLQFLTHVIPARYFISIIKGLFLKGVGFSVLAMDTMFLAIFAAVLLVIANLTFRKRLE